MDAAPAVLAAADTTDTARPAVADTARVALADTAPQPPSAASGAGGLSAFVPATSSPAVAAPAVDRPGDTGTAAPPVGARPAGNNPADAASARAAGGQHYLHVTSFRTADQADAEAAGFTARGLPAFVRTQTVRGVLWHRVCLGPYGTHDDAVRLANRLRDEGTITYYKIIPVGAGEGQ
jgi:cell division protein FtsN